VLQIGWALTQFVFELVPAAGESTCPVKEQERVLDETARHVPVRSVRCMHFARLQQSRRQRGQAVGGYGVGFAMVRRTGGHHSTTKVGLPPGSRYDDCLEALRNASTYEIKKDRLRIFYDKKTKALHFKAK